MLRLLLFVAVEDITATAVFNTGGITGYVKFTEIEGGVSIIANLEGLSQDADWFIAELPVMTTIAPELRAQPDFVGNIYNPDKVPGELCRQDNPVNCSAGNLVGK